MPRVGLTEEQIQDFRSRTVEAATRLFAEHGYDAVSMRAVAGAIGVSPMTPYRYFENKDELFAMVRADAFRRFADQQRDAFESTDDPNARLRALGEAYVQFALDEPAAYRIMFELAQAPTGRYPKLDREALRGFSYNRRAVQEAVAAGVIAGEPLTISNLLWAFIHGIVSLHLAGKLAMGRSVHELIEATLNLRMS